MADVEQVHLGPQVALEGLAGIPCILLGDGPEHVAVIHRHQHGLGHRVVGQAALRRAQTDQGIVINAVSGRLQQSVVIGAQGQRLLVGLGVEDEPGGQRLHLLDPARLEPGEGEQDTVQLRAEHREVHQRPVLPGDKGQQAHILLPLLLPEGCLQPGAAEFARLVQPGHRRSPDGVRAQIGVDLADRAHPGQPDIVGVAQPLAIHGLGLGGQGLISGAHGVIPTAWRNRVSTQLSPYRL